MVNIIQPITVSKPTMELLTHAGEHLEIGDGGWLMMTTATDSPLRTRPGGQAHPPPSWIGCGPPDADSFASIFY